VYKFLTSNPTSERVRLYTVDTVVAAVSTELVDPHSLSFSDAVDESSFTDVDHGLKKDGRGAVPACCCDDDRCILAPLGTLRCSAPFLLLGWRSRASAARCLGALWDRALALDDSVLLM
jgi:hypothetical protein